MQSDINEFTHPLQVRWSDIDANRHLRHSVYYDYGALCRMALFTKVGLSLENLQEQKIGPVLLREEAVFRREIHFEDRILITAELLKASEDYSRWSFRHRLVKGDDILAATLTVDGGWIDIEKRKLALPGESLRQIFSLIPRAPEFEIIELTKKTNG